MADFGPVVVVSLRGGDPITRPLTEHEMEKRGVTAARFAAEQTMTVKRKALSRALDSMEEVEVLAASPDAVTLARIGVARRMVQNGRMPPSALLDHLRVERSDI